MREKKKFALDGCTTLGRPRRPSAVVFGEYRCVTQRLFLPPTREIFFCCCMSDSLACQPDMLAGLNCGTTKIEEHPGGAATRKQTTAGRSSVSLSCNSNCIDLGGELAV
jgi:hypothetical protein